MKTTAKKATKMPPAGQAEAISRHLGGRVKALRGERGWSLEALATASVVSRSMLRDRKSVV